jgi:uroporphyrinogen-III decarboxylase
MKKKYRDITVDGVKYAWMVSNGDTLTIWKDKKVIGNIDVTHCTVTPKIVAEAIKNFNAHEKDFRERVSNF